MSTLTLLIVAILLAFFLVLVIAWACLKITSRLGLIDRPGSASHKQHASPKPLAGGIVMVVALLPLAWLFRTILNHDIWAAFVAGMLVFGFGLWDDYRSLSPSVKIFGQLLAAAVMIRLGLYIRIFESPQFFFTGHGALDVYLDWLLTVFWVVGITNAFNFVDSMDGLAAGLGGIASAIFMLMAFDAGQAQLAIQYALLVGACIGLYFFNASPAVFFLGDSGAQTLGFVLAVLAIVYRPQGTSQLSSWLVPVLVLGLPIFDTCLVFFSRLRRNKPVYASSLDHTYHRLVAFGLDANRAVVVMHGISILLGCLAFVALSMQPLLANAIFAVCLASGLLGILYLDSKKRWT